MAILNRVRRFMVLAAALLVTVMVSASPYGCGGGGDDCIDKCNKSCEHSSNINCASDCATRECFSAFD